jgi:hypothetical protein
VAELEAADSRDVAFPRDFIDLDGRWRLLYSSNVLGVTRVSPLQLDEVYQVIDTSLNSVKNVVYGTLRPPLFGKSARAFAAIVVDLVHLLKPAACSISLPQQLKPGGAFL